MKIEIINIGEVIEVFNRFGEFKGRGVVVRHQDSDYTHIIRLTEVQPEIYPTNYEVGGEYGYQAPGRSRADHLRGGARAAVDVADELVDDDNPF